MLFAKIANLVQKRSIHLLRDKAFVNGEWISAKSNQTFNVINPTNLEIIGTAPDMSTEDTELAIKSAHKAFEAWQDLPAKERAHLLRDWYNLMVENSQSLAEIIHLESGKPLCEALAEVNYGNSFVEFFSEEARRIHGEIIESPVKTKKILIERQAVGVAGLITPWNFPHAMISRKASAALAAGCTCVIKPAEDTPFTALALMDLAEKAGFPKGVLNVVTSDRKHAPAIGGLFCTSGLVEAISFTGSTQVGKWLYQQCSQGVKRLGLELGGNAPFIVFNSACIESAVKGALASKFRNCGQTCVASNRFFIQCEVFDEFVGKLVEGLERVEVGPLINDAQFKKVAGLVEDALAKGGKILCGGEALPELGPLFYKPTVLTDITKDMRLSSEEVFGPVVSLFPFETEEECLELANNTERGLAGYFYSQDVAQIFRVSRKLEVGMVGVNEGAISTAEAPFGGIKESGLGREGSHYGIDDYVYIKYICLGGL